MRGLSLKRRRLGKRLVSSRSLSSRRAVTAVAVVIAVAVVVVVVVAVEVVVAVAVVDVATPSPSSQHLPNWAQIRKKNSIWIGTVLQLFGKIYYHQVYKNMTYNNKGLLRENVTTYWWKRYALSQKSNNIHSSDLLKK